MSSKPKYSCSRKNWPTSSGEGPEARMPVPGYGSSHLILWIIYRSAVTFASVLHRHWEEVNPIVPALLEPHSNKAAPRVTKPDQQGRSRRAT